MNQDTVKTNLLKLYNCTEDFAVFFSGKKSKKVNGLYKPDKREIIIHNRNFTADEAGNNLLFYTAMHELAHHIQFTECKQKSVKAHTQLFYSTLDNLVDTAEKKKLYNIGIDNDTQKIINEVKEISCQIAELQQKLGQTLLRLEKKCREKGVRFEDVIERKAQLSRKTVKNTIKAHNMGINGVGADIQEAVISETDEDKRREMLIAAQKGKSVDQIKATATVPVNKDDEIEMLIKEKNRIMRSIENLKHRLEEVVEHLKSKGEL